MVWSGWQGSRRGADCHTHPAEGVSVVAVVHHPPERHIQQFYFSVTVVLYMRVCACVRACVFNNNVVLYSACIPVDKELMALIPLSEQVAWQRLMHSPGGFL